MTLLTLRPAVTADVAVLTKLAQDSFVDAFAHLYSEADLSAFLREAKSQEATAALIADPHGAMQVAERDGTPIAFCKIGYKCGWPEQARGNRAMELKQLYAAASATGSGVGTALMDWALDAFNSAGADEVQLSVYSGNHGAQRFYARYGFKKVADVTFKVGEQIDEEYLFSKLL
ncbi:MAG: N-acetyltransferase family protein [Novosphingobium sp.]